MRDFKLEYQAGVKKHSMDENLQMNTLRKINELKTTRKKHMKLKYFVSVAIIVILSTVSVVGINKPRYLRPSEWGGYKGHLYNENEQGEIDKVADVDGTVNIDKTMDMDNLTITVKSFVTDNNLVYLNFDVETKDGSPLQVDTDNEKSVIVRQGFENAYIECENERFKLHMFRIDDAVVPNKASFEATVAFFSASDDLVVDENSGMLKSDFDFTGKDVTLYLGDYMDERQVSSSIGYKFDSLADLCDKITPLGEDDFINMGTMITYADGSTASAFTLPKGNQKIYFSDEYPEAYIDNIGFKMSGEKGIEGKWFYISIVPGSQENYKALSKLCFQNKETGYLSYSYDVNYGEDVDTSYNDGRIILVLDAALYAQGDKEMEKLRDLDISDLSNYTLKLYEESLPEVLVSGSTSLTFNVNDMAQEVTYEVNQTMETEDRIITFDTFTASPLYIKYSGTLVEKNGYNKKSIRPILLFDDGSKVDAGVKLSGGYDGLGKFSFDIALQTVIDVDHLIGIEIDGQQILFQK